MTEYKHREISGAINEALGTMPVVVLSGMRQSGKSTLLVNQPELKKRKYFSFDDFATLEAARRNPEDFIKSDQPLTVDEAQKFPELLSAIKHLVDKKRRPGQFLLSGSANFLLLKSVSESLAGRAVYLTMQPFSRREISGQTRKIPALLNFLKKNVFPERQIKNVTFQEIVGGGMPLVCLGKAKTPAVWFRGYEQTYLERDLRDLSQVADLVTFRHLLQLAAFRNSQILKMSELARDAKLNVVTTSRYLSLMETSFIINRLYPYLGNPAKRLIKSPKIYLADSGLAFYLMGMTADSLGGVFKGALFENYVFQNLLGIFQAHAPEVKITFWNIQGRYEVDFVLEAGNETIAIEIKNSSRWGENDLNGLKAYLEVTKKCRAAILAYNGTKLFKLDKKIWAVPIGLLLS